MITVKCSCGKIYQVKDSYASKKAKCSCGKIISVPDKPDPSLESESNKPPEKICFSCNCGKSFQVSPKFEGKKVRCKSCQTILTVPMQSKSDTDDDQIVDEPVQSEIKSEKQVDEKPKSSEKPKRLLLICLAMVLIGAIAYDLFLMYSEKPEESDKDKPAVTAPAQTDVQDEEQISTEKTTAETIDDSQAPSDEVSSDVEEKTEPEAEAPEAKTPEAEAPETIKDEAPPEPEASQKKTEKTGDLTQKQVKPPESEPENAPVSSTKIEPSEKMPVEPQANDTKSETISQQKMAAIDPGTHTQEKKKILRSNPMTYTKKQVIDMIQGYNFYESQLNPNGGYPNRLVDNLNGTISDNETQLMWQKSGTREMVSWKKAPEYIDRLNNRKYAGYSDWRLPTLEELLTLTEPRHTRQGLYISGFFSQKQGIVASSDSCTFDGKKIPWYISFLRGISNCISYDLIDEFHVRAVRSMEHSKDTIVN